MPHLNKGPKYNIADSNIALLGSDLEKKVKQNAANSEAAWKGIGEKEGIDVWRIEQFKVVPWPKNKYGIFFSGDSYIVLRTYRKSPEDKKLSYDVHFWLGKDTTQDEAGTAAYKTVELDDYLHGAAVQHREVQDYESDSFKGYFPNFTVQEGGIEGGFKHVEATSYRPRLLRIRTEPKTQRVIAREVELSWKSLNAEDVFVLDAGLNLYQWTGNRSKPMARTKAAELCRAIDTDRDGKPVVDVFSQDDKDLAPVWKILGTPSGPIPEKAEAHPTEAKNATRGNKALFRLSDASGRGLEFTPASKAGDKVKRDMLDSNDVFVFDAGDEVFVWIGSKSSAEERRKGLQYAQEYLVKYNRPPWLPIARVIEGGENEIFNLAFDH